MSAFHRSAGLLLFSLLAIGCGSGEPPAPPPAEPPGPDVTELGDGSLVRGGGPGSNPALKSEPAAAPKPGDMVLPEGGGAWPWNLAPAPPPEPTRPVTIPGYFPTESTTSGVVVSPASRRAVVLVGERVKDEERMTRVVWCDLAAGKVLAEWKVKGIYAPLDLHPDGHQLLAVRPPREGRTDLLELWTIEVPNRLQRQSWQPHSAPAAAPDGDILVAAEGPDPGQPGDPARDGGIL